MPVLRDVKDKAILSDNPDAPNHILIEGDNLEALTALSYTHEGKIDVIYIDPPYNTGNKDFVYNDSFVDSEDSYRHSKWLSFMNKRLKIAKKLLSDKGVIFISIDDNEQANLKLLCDGVFGEKNFVASLIWRGGKRNMSKWISTSHEYMLLYANNLSYCAEIGVEWNEKKQGINEIYSNAKRFVRESNGNFEVASSRLKDWFKELPDSNPSKDHKHYCWIDEKEYILLQIYQEVVEVDLNGKLQTPILEKSLKLLNEVGLIQHLKNYKMTSKAASFILMEQVYHVKRDI